MATLVTFDFDDTLTVPFKDKEGFWLSGGYQPNFDTIKILQDTSAQGHVVSIVTSRPYTEGSEKKIKAFVEKYELPVDELVFTNGGWKADVLEEMASILHYDDDLEELERIKAKGIAVIEIPHPPGPRR